MRLMGSMRIVVGTALIAACGDNIRPRVGIDASLHDATPAQIPPNVLDSTIVPCEP